MEKKVPRIQRRAQYEVNVVRICSEKYDRMLIDAQKKVFALESKVNLLIEQGKLALNETEKKNLAREIKNLRNSIALRNREIESIKSTVELFDQLLTALDVLESREDYRYIVRKIPERKLPNLVKDLGKRDQLNELLASLLDKLDMDNRRRAISDNEAAKARKAREEEQNEFYGRNSADESDLNEIMKEFETDTEVVIAIEESEQNATNMTANKN